MRSYFQTGNKNRHIQNKYYNVAGLEDVKHIFANGKLIATIESEDATTTPYYVHTDHLDATNIVTNMEIW